jgi:hypothetical protein
MSVVLFFTMTGSIVIVGLVFVTLTIRHHWQQYKLSKKQQNQI